jgi:membrane-bound lytic murein transglycosylase D
MIRSHSKAFVAAFVLVSIIVIVLFVAPTIKGYGETITGEEFLLDTVLSNRPYKIPDKVSFAGEEMPLENFDTRESLDREILTSAYRHSSTILIIKRANRYLPVIEKILEKNGIPDDFKYLVAAESEYSNMISPAGATGFWQIMSATGKEAGMEINNVIDERYHIEKSTQFACDYFLKSYEKYGNWTLAAASYNGGRSAIDEQIRIQKENNYYDLLLTEETARYIFRAVAYKLIISDPSSYSFEITKDELYPELQYYEVKVDSAINDMADFAKNYGTNYKLLKYLNPWLRKPYFVPRPGKEYKIKIPIEGMRNIEMTEVEF